MKRSLLAAAACLLMAAGDPPNGNDPKVVTMSPDQQRTIDMQTTQAERRPITEPVRAAATIAFDPGHVAVLRPLAQARVTRLLAQSGDQVKANQPLATLDVPSLITQEETLVSARASLREAEAAMSVARDALRRGETLARDGSLSRAEAERRRLVLAQAQARRDAAENRVQALQTQVNLLNPGNAPGSAELTSPISGIVANVNVTTGELIDTATNSFTVADLSTVVALAQVPEASAALVAVGDAATLRQATGGDQTWHGTVAAIGAELDPRARTLPARISLSNPEQVLRAGMFVEATITSNRGRDDVTIPAAAVQLIGDRHVAFMPLDGNRFQARDLTLGVERTDWVEVRNGIRPGDRVVTNGSFALKSLLQQAMLGGGGD